MRDSHDQTITQKEDVSLQAANLIARKQKELESQVPPST